MDSIYSFAFIKSSKVVNSTTKQINKADRVIEFEHRIFNEPK